MNKNKRLLASKFLKAASEEFGNHGCNDYTIPNTDENWQLICDMETWNGTLEKDKSPRPPLNEEIYVPDFYIMAYLAHCLENDENE